MRSSFRLSDRGGEGAEGENWGSQQLTSTESRVSDLQVVPGEELDSWEGGDTGGLTEEV